MRFWNKTQEAIEFQLESRREGDCEAKIEVGKYVIYVEAPQGSEISVEMQDGFMNESSSEDIEDDE